MSVVVVDNFLNNAAGTREYALTLPYDVKGNYPGARTRSFANAGWIPYLEKHLGGEKITWFDTHPFSYNGAFQVCTAADGDSWIHRDGTDWAGVLFLSDAAPADAGLTLYRHRATGALGSAGYAPKTVAVLDADAPDPAKWEVSSRIGNVFNRLVLFRGTQFHKSAAYFGDSKASGRLFQVLFFNTVSPPLRRWALSLPRVLVVVFSTNRYDYLEQTLEGLRRHVDFGGCGAVKTMLIDDYPAARDAARAQALEDRFGVDIVVRHSTNKGLGLSWRETWDAIRARPELGDWIFHLEDDAVFRRPVAVREVIESFASSPDPLTQVFFKRTVCYAPETDFISRIEAGTLGKDVTGTGGIGVTQNAYFVAMASVYPRELVTRYVSDKDPHEHTVRDYFGAWGMTSGMWGARDAPPAVEHVGTVSRGLKVSEYDAEAARFARLPVGRDYHFATGEPIP